MDALQLQKWFSSLKEELETAYLKNDKPWEQSGFYISEDAWIVCRKPIADCVDKSGSFLDIGCANGYLLECILKWTAERGLNIIPCGIDLSEKLVNLARERMPECTGNFQVGNGLYWNNPVRFDYVRTELVYVPEELQKEYIDRITNVFLKADGKLLLTEYRSRKTPAEKPWIDSISRDWGYTISGQASGFWEGKELVRVFVIKSSPGG